MPFMFKCGKEYETQAGEMVTVLGRDDGLKGYETLICSDGKHRYDRSDSNMDAGRCTGTDHDYSYMHNFKRADIRLGITTTKEIDMEKDLVQPAYEVTNNLEHKIKAVELLERRLDAKNAAISTLELELYRKNLECRSFERKADASLTMGILISIVSFINIGFIVYRYF